MQYRTLQAIALKITSSTAQCWWRRGGWRAPTGSGYPMDSGTSGWWIGSLHSDVKKSNVGEWCGPFLNVYLSLLDSNWNCWLIIRWWHLIWILYLLKYTCRHICRRSLRGFVTWWIRTSRSGGSASRYLCFLFIYLIHNSITMQWSWCSRKGAKFSQKAYQIFMDWALSPPSWPIYDIQVKFI